MSNTPEDERSDALDYELCSRILKDHGFPDTAALFDQANTLCGQSESLVLDFTKLPVDAYLVAQPMRLRHFFFCLIQLSDEGVCASLPGTPQRSVERVRPSFQGLALSWLAVREYATVLREVGFAARGTNLSVQDERGWRTGTERFSFRRGVLSVR